MFSGHSSSWPLAAAEASCLGFESSNDMAVKPAGGRRPCAPPLIGPGRSATNVLPERELPISKYSALESQTISIHWRPTVERRGQWKTPETSVSSYLFCSYQKYRLSSDGAQLHEIREPMPIRA